MTLSMNVATIDHPGRDRPVEPGLYLCDVSGSRLWRWNGVFRLIGLADGEPTELAVAFAEPGLLELEVGGGRIEVTWDGTSTILFRGTGAGLRLEQSVLDPMDAALAFAHGEGFWRLQMGEDAHFALQRRRGEVSVDAPNVRTGESAVTDHKVIDAVPGDDGLVEFAITQYESGYVESVDVMTFESALADVRADFDGFASGFSNAPHRTDQLAAYVLWECIVEPRGQLQRPAVLMSKNWMNAVWSWDHCFNALGLARAHPDLAWDQFMLLFDHQHPQGSLPDLVHDNGSMWGFVKPPVHGWTLGRLIESGVAHDARLREIYPRLAEWTNWWLIYRDGGHGGLCEYFHGCDSGQDNSAAFDHSGFPALSPDLATYLILQFDVLAHIAERVGDAADAPMWRSHADAMTAALLEHLWDGERFRVIPARSAAPDGADVAVSQIGFIPLLLGDRLPDTVRETMLDALAGSGLLTPFGVASESPTSPSYEADGYWRGPVWAPTTLLIAEGLRASGRPDLADEVRAGFTHACEASGFAENYDATTGVALRDTAYSWSAGVYYTFAAQLDSLSTQHPTRKASS